jgi:peptidoglycan lytic transglycosylase
MRAFLAALLVCACVTAASAESGIASVYWEGTRTANGERLCRACLTAAHRTLPFGTLAKVCRSGGNCIVVRINDRGPFVRGRIIDMTPAGAHALGFSGLARVTVEAIGK